MFDVQKLSDFAITKIQEFSNQHPDEVFYAFAIDASMLCLNTTEHFEITLEEYLAKWPNSYNTPEKVNALKYNPGDWKYQGFANFEELNTEDANGYPTIGPFDSALYEKHYYMDGNAQKTSEYSIAMQEVIKILESKNAFGFLQKTNDFRISSVEHNY